MEIIALPPILPGALDLIHVNQRLRAQQIQLDWSAVEVAPDDALATLLWGLDLSDHADALGIGTVPDALSSTLLSMVSKPQTGGKKPRAALGVKFVETFLN